MPHNERKWSQMCWVGICLMMAPKGAAEEQPWDMLTAKPEVVRAWQDMRFGMFLCWGPVSLTGEEIGWSRGAPRGHGSLRLEGQGPTPGEVYDNLYKKWKPDRFDARAVGAGRPGRGSAVPDLPGQAPRRVLPVRLEADRLQDHRTGVGLEAGCAGRRGPGVPRGGPEADRLLLAARLAPSRLRHGEPFPLHRVSPRPGPRDPDQLRPDRRLLVRPGREAGGLGFGRSCSR